MNEPHQHPLPAAPPRQYTHYLDYRLVETPEDARNYILSCFAFILNDTPPQRAVNEAFLAIEKPVQSYWVCRYMDGPNIYYVRMPTSGGFICKLKKVRMPYNTTITLYSVLESYIDEITYDYEQYKPGLDILPTWEHWPCVRRRRGIPRILNTFCGFHSGRRSSQHGCGTGLETPVEPSSAVASEPDTIAMAINHIRDVWAGGQDDIYQYIINWFAHLLQKPAEARPAIIITGDPGTGKDILLNWFGQHVIGQRYYRRVISVKELLVWAPTTQTHLTVCVCAKLADNHPYGFKKPNTAISLYTQLCKLVHRKQYGELSDADYCNYIFVSNEAAPIPLARDDSMFFTIACRGNSETLTKSYFSELCAGLTEESGYDMFRWLATRDISGWDPARMPASGDRASMKLLAVPRPVQFLVDICRGVAGRRLTSGGDADSRANGSTTTNSDMDNGAATRADSVIQLDSTKLYEEYCRWICRRPWDRPGPISLPEFRRIIVEVTGCRKLQHCRVGLDDLRDMLREYLREPLWEP